MAKNVFRPQEIVNLTSSISIDAPYNEEPEIEEVQSIEEYSGPTADDLRREAEAFKTGWEEEKARMISEAEEEAQAIIKHAEETAFNQVKAKTDEAQVAKQEAEEEAKRIVEEARGQAERELDDARRRVSEIEEEARATGEREGREQGFGEGKAEVERLIAQLHSIINRAIEKRNEIIEQSETEVVNLVLQIAKKVVKVISENQKNVVINNVIQALRKLKSRGEIIIKVNLEDVQLTSDHVKDFMRMVEGVRSITVLEDTSVDRGGCVIETDFGKIDARISSQLKEIEERITDLVPITVKGEQ